MTSFHYQFNTDSQEDEFMLIHKGRYAAFKLITKPSMTQNYTELEKQINKAYKELDMDIDEPPSSPQ